MHFIYVASGERFVKVGITTRPKARALAIAREFRRRGDAMTKFSVMPGIPAGYGVECGVCHELASLANEVHGREWFLGLTHKEAEEIVRPRVMGVRRFQLGNKNFLNAPTAPARGEAKDAQGVSHGFDADTGRSAE